jgi:hypothetical protein
MKLFFYKFFTKIAKCFLRNNMAKFTITSFIKEVDVGMIIIVPILNLGKNLIAYASTVIQCAHKRSSKEFIWNYGNFRLDGSISTSSKSVEDMIGLLAVFLPIEWVLKWRLDVLWKLNSEHSLERGRTFRVIESMTR